MPSGAMNEPEHSAKGPARRPQVPWPRGPLHEPLMAYLVAELGELTTNLEQLRARITEDVATFESDQGVLQFSHQTGWILGVLAAAAGEDILLARRERTGLSILVDRVRALLVAEGSGLPLAAEALSTVELVGPDWEIPWATANALYVAGSEECSSMCDWTFMRVDSEHVLRGYGEVGERLAELAADLTRALPGTSFRTSRTEWLLSFETPSSS